MNQERIFQVLKGPRISEKAAMAADAGNQVVFTVAVDASKLEIKHAVEKLFDVKVDSVNVVNVKGKVKRNRYGLARRASLKKAYVRLAEGQEIDFSVAE
jgi:large subunit ribosomal protein L23